MKITQLLGLIDLNVKSHEKAFTGELVIYKKC